MKRMTRRKRSTNWRGESKEPRDGRWYRAMKEKNEWWKKKSPFLFFQHKSEKYLAIFSSVLIHEFSLFSPPSSPFFLPFFSPHFGFISSATVCVCIHVIIPLWECIYVCRVRACARVCPSQPPQKPLCFSSVAFSTVAKTGSSPRWLSAANGGAGVGLLGHVSGWRPCLSARTDARQISLCLSEVGMWEHYESEQNHVEKLGGIKGFHEASTN